MDLDDSTQRLPSLSAAIRDRGRSLLQTLTHRPAYRNVLLLGHLLLGGWTLMALGLTLSQSDLTQRWERQLQTVFYGLRGPVAAPDNVIILAIDDSSLNDQSQSYALDPKTYAYLEPIAQWPWQRTAYAVAIDRLMQAGAKAVIVDVVLDASSSYGDADDEQLRRVLEKYPGRVTLAAQVEVNEVREGIRINWLLPNQAFRTTNLSTGFINVPIAPDGSIYQFGDSYIRQQAQQLTLYSPGDATALMQQNQEIPSFAEAAMQAAQQTHPALQGQDIFFYGPANESNGMFKRVAFWHVLEPANWKVYLDNGLFRDKVVVIGPTANNLQDFHLTPFGRMPGVEIQASAIANLLQHRLIQSGLSSSSAKGLWVGGVVLVVAYLQTRSRRPLRRLGTGIGLAVLVLGVGYGVFVWGQRTLPLSIPGMAIVCGSLSYLVTGLIAERIRMREALKPYSQAPMLQELATRDDNIRDLLSEQQQDFLHRILGARYKVVKDLGAGGFGKTYIAVDTQRPGTPTCVVKRLKPASNDPKLFQLARKLFHREAETLENLGLHPQIPQLLAYFEEDEEFYLVQEYIEGRSLSDELVLGRQLPESRVLEMLQELLPILEFIHSHRVIHRDIKPSNVIRRQSDGKLVLIDFGAVKAINQLEDVDRTGFTIGIGTQGYMPNEQSAGHPRFNSDIYALGMTAIQALTGLPPSQMKQDVRSGEVLWRHLSRSSRGLADVLSKMVRYHFEQRYQSAGDVLEALRSLANEQPVPTHSEAALFHRTSLGMPESLTDPQTATATSAFDSTEANLAEDEATKLWPETFDDAQGEDSSNNEMPDSSKANPSVMDDELIHQPPTDIAPD